MGTIPPVPMLPPPRAVTVVSLSVRCAYCGRQYKGALPESCVGCGAPIEDEYASAAKWAALVPSIVMGLPGKRFPDMANRDLITDIYGGEIDWHRVDDVPEGSFWRKFLRFMGVRAVESKESL